MDFLHLNMWCFQKGWLLYLWEEKLLATLSEVMFLVFFTRIVTSVKIHVKFNFHIEAK